MQMARILSEISRDSDAFRQSMGFNTVPTPTSSPSYTPTIPDLPAIPDVRTEFIEIGIPPEIAQSLYDVYYDRVCQLRMRSLRQMAQLVRVPDILSDGIVRAITKTFLKQLETWKKQVIDLTCAQLRTNQCQTTRSRGHKVFKVCPRTDPH